MLLVEWGYNSTYTYSSTSLKQCRTWAEKQCRTWADPKAHATQSFHGEIQTERRAGHKVFKRRLIQPIQGFLFVY